MSIRMSSTPDVLTAATRLGIDSSPLEAACAEFDRVQRTNPGTHLQRSSESREAQSVLAGQVVATSQAIRSLFDALDVLNALAEQNDLPSAMDAETRTVLAAMNRLRAAAERRDNPR